MNLHPKRLQLPGGCCLCFCLLGASLHAQAGGFALIEHGASGMGNAYAGAAAVSADASTIWVQSGRHDRNRAARAGCGRACADHQHRI